MVTTKNVKKTVGIEEMDDGTMRKPVIMAGKTNGTIVVIHGMRTETTPTSE